MSVLLKAVVFAFSLVAVAGCATQTPKQQEATSAADSTNPLERPHVNLGSDDFSKHTIDAWAQFKKMYIALRGSDPGAAQPSKDILLEYIDSSYAFIDDRCNEYFKALNLFHKKKRESVQTANIVTAGLTAIMAALHSAAKEIATVAVGGTTTAALIENQGSALLYALDPATTLSLVSKAKVAYQSNVPSANIVTFQQAMLVAQGYAQLCMPATIERMVNEAITSGTAKATTSSTIDQLYSAASRTARDALSTVLQTKSGLSDADLFALYWLVELGGEADAESRKIIKGKLPSNIRDLLFESDKDDLKSTAPIANIQSAIRKIVEVDPRLRTSATQFRAEELDKAKKAVAAAKPGAAPPPSVAQPPVTQQVPTFVRPHVFF